MINGANIRLWCISKGIDSALQEQVAICKANKWTVIRDNSSEMGYEWSNGSYTLADEVAQASKLLRLGLKVMLTISDCNPWLDKCVTPQQFDALRARYKGDLLNTRRAINSIGIATAMPKVVDGVLNRSNALFTTALGKDPYFLVEMDNGGEGVQWRGGPWDVLSDGFMRDMRALGFNFPHPWIPLYLRQAIIRRNIQNLRDKLHESWLNRLVGPAMHLYDWGYTVNQLGESSNIVTEYGASINEGIQRGKRLVEMRRTSPPWREMMLLHSPVDSRFMETFFSGETLKLWKSPDYQQLLAARGVGPVEYDGLLALEPAALAEMATFAT